MTLTHSASCVSCSWTGTTKPSASMRTRVAALDRLVGEAKRHATEAGHTVNVAGRTYSTTCGRCGAAMPSAQTECDACMFSRIRRSA